MSLYYGPYLEMGDFIAVAMPRVLSQKHADAVDILASESVAQRFC